METPTPFDLDLTVRAHGFYDLAPWNYDPARRVLARPLRVAPGRVVDAEVAPRDGPGGGVAVRLKAVGRIAEAEAAEARRQLRVCLAFDEDLTPFYARIRELGGRGPPELRWAVERGAGRLLRSPTVFEDAVKTLCTTNCSWALTRVMTSNLVERLGESGPGGARAFPTPDAMAAQPERFYREVIRAGYRAGALRELARRVAAGELDVEAWRTSAATTDELGDAIVELPGFGPYATEHLLRLLGRHDHLALDSWTRAKLTRLRGRRRVPTDRVLRRWYAPYGRFAGLAMWLEVTADWHGASPTWP